MGFQVDSECWVWKLIDLKLWALKLWVFVVVLGERMIHGLLGLRR